MSVIVEPCTEADILALAPIYFAAFEETIISRKCFPHTPIVEKWWIDLLLHEFKHQPTARFIKASLVDGEDKKMGLAKAHESVCGDRQHWYLELIATHPDARGKGAARQMLQWGINLAEEEPRDGHGGLKGVPCFLEASPNGRKVFEREGFRQIGETFKLEFDEEVYEETFMMRDVGGPRAS
ncbi:acyl-CoA N-acyltransferase [Flagelloscypha sp. PMI_526]|nr:acyl-CoA N-acyltransferase [Flagelloscypha sp. PMI_526]